VSPNTTRDPAAGLGVETVNAAAGPVGAGSAVSTVTRDDDDAPGVADRAARATIRTGKPVETRRRRRVRIRMVDIIKRRKARGHPLGRAAGRIR
jgi:hypothetical protein